MKNTRSRETTRIGILSTVFAITAVFLFFVLPLAVLFPFHLGSIVLGTAAALIARACRSMANSTVQAITADWGLHLAIWLAFALVASGIALPAKQALYQALINTAVFTLSYTPAFYIGRRREPAYIPVQYE